MYLRIGETTMAKKMKFIVGDRVLMQGPYKYRKTRNGVVAEVEEHLGYRVRFEGLVAKSKTNPTWESYEHFVEGKDLAIHPENVRPDEEESLEDRAHHLVFEAARKGINQAVRGLIAEGATPEALKAAVGQTLAGLPQLYEEYTDFSDPQYFEEDGDIFEELRG